MKEEELKEGWIIPKEEINKLFETESEIVLKNMNDEFEILVEEEEKSYKDCRKLPYPESYDTHWCKRLYEIFEYFYDLGENQGFQKAKEQYASTLKKEIALIWDYRNGNITFNELLEKRNSIFGDFEEEEMK